MITETEPTDSGLTAYKSTEPLMHRLLNSQLIALAALKFARYSTSSSVLSVPLKSEAKPTDTKCSALLSKIMIYFNIR